MVEGPDNPRMRDRMDMMSRLAPPIIWKKALEEGVRKANPFSRDRCRLVSTGNAAAGWSDQIMSEDEAAEDLPPAAGTETYPHERPPAAPAGHVPILGRSPEAGWELSGG